MGMTHPNKYQCVSRTDSLSYLAYLRLYHLNGVSFVSLELTDVQTMDVSTSGNLTQATEASRSYVAPNHFTLISHLFGSSTMDEKWQELVTDKQKRQQESIPKEWFIDLPPAGRLNFIDFPREYGLLSEFELEITESKVEAHLPKLASGELSAADVTWAFTSEPLLLTNWYVSSLH